MNPIRNKKWILISLNMTKNNQIKKKYISLNQWFKQLILKASLFILLKSLKYKVKKNWTFKDIPYIFPINLTKLKLNIWLRYWTLLITKKMQFFSLQQEQVKHYVFFLPLWVGFRNNFSKLMNKYPLFTYPERIPNLLKFKNNFRKHVLDQLLQYLVQEIYSV